MPQALIWLWRPMVGHRSSNFSLDNGDLDLILSTVPYLMSRNVDCTGVAVLLPELKASI